jgi:hypothetical protein
MTKQLLFSDHELELFYQEMLTLSKETRLDPYESYMYYLTSIEPPPKKPVKRSTKKLVEPSTRELVALSKKESIEIHHKLPRFAGGTDSEDNLLRMTYNNHTKAHWLRWKVYGESRDLSAFLFRNNQTEEAQALKQQHVLEAREREKKKGVRRHDSNYQREMGTRGGQIGGKANTPQQFAARQKVGQIYGTKVGKGNQSTELIEFISKFSVWARKPVGKKFDITKTSAIYIVAPKESFAEVARKLEEFVPGMITNESTMHKLVKKERPSMYGWVIVDTLIRSEYEKGLSNLLAKYEHVDIFYDKID